MRTEALDRVKLVFSLFDADGNRYLEADDFELMAERVIQAVPEADEAAKSAMLAGFRKYWTTLVRELDANHDNRISFDEYVACVLAPERFSEAISEFAESLVGMGHLDGDGFIGRPAFTALMRAIGFAPANIDALFDAFEPTDADRIAATTWITGIKEYYSPDKAGIPGDHLVATPTT
ncbi:EF-hand domain-containing protein [Peterkaempfera bronchialis]|uniref:EF-hand domain-containing protein n=1 Tax=Peterkaempfera bronchialis TaxID=2126346 RepID=A0A345SRF6_9ACTN|nr:EF-hand domain-containing protein [Peterkaempfera bronchialis]AXI76311.1 EF-hand domain-containing protein [Peterkaempfera bronchialis]